MDYGISIVARKFNAGRGGSGFGTRECRSGGSLLAHTISGRSAVGMIGSDDDNQV